MPENELESKGSILFAERRPSFIDSERCKVLKEYDMNGVDEFIAHVETADGFRIESHPAVIGVQPNETCRTRDFIGVTASSQSSVATMSDVRKLHNITSDGASGRGLTAVVMDSGIDYSHEVFDGVNIERVDVTGAGVGDNLGHGTAVAGQISQIAPKANIISLKIFDDEGTTTMDIILEAYEWLFRNVSRYDAVNMSWGTTRKVEEIDNLQNKLVEKGVRDVVAAGNTGDDGGSPATADKSFSIGACTEEGTMTDFSSHNPNYDNPDVAAVGKNCKLAQASGTVMGVDLSGPWVKASGTSFSSPEVMGMVLKYMETRDGNVVEAFEAAADNIEDVPEDGAGLANYGNIEGGKEIPEPPEDTEADVWAFAENDALFIHEDLLESGDYSVSVVEERDDGAVLDFTKVKD